MQADRFTIKSQEALAAAGRLADERRNPQVTPAHLLAALLARARRHRRRATGADAPAASCCPCCASSASRPPALRAGSPAALDALPRLRELRRRAGRRAPAPSSSASCAPPSARRASSSRRVRLDRAPAARARRPPRAAPATRCAPPAPTRERLLEALAEVRGSHRVTDQTPEEQATRRSRASGATSPTSAEDGKLDPVIGRDDEIRRVDPGPLPPHQEQPRADRRARRRQDRDRRGPRPADRLRRRARVAAATAA